MIEWLGQGVYILEINLWMLICIGSVFPVPFSRPDNDLFISRFLFFYFSFPNSEKKKTRVKKANSRRKLGWNNLANNVSFVFPFPLGVCEPFYSFFSVSVVSSCRIIRQYGLIPIDRLFLSALRPFFPPSFLLLRYQVGRKKIRKWNWEELGWMTQVFSVIIRHLSSWKSHVGKASKNKARNWRRKIF